MELSWAVRGCVGVPRQCWAGAVVTEQCWAAQGTLGSVGQWGKLLGSHYLHLVLMMGRSGQTWPRLAMSTCAQQGCVYPQSRFSYCPFP